MIIGQEKRLKLTSEGRWKTALGNTACLYLGWDVNTKREKTLFFLITERSGSS